MTSEHLTGDALQALLQGDEETRNRLLLHHLSVCPQCHAACGYFLDLWREGLIGLSPSTVDVAIARSRREAPALWERLAPLPYEARLAAVREEPAFRSWGLCELLCRESEREARGNPARAREIAHLAVEASRLIPEWEPAEELWLHELQALSLAHLGNALRVLGDLRAAEEAFRSADRIWEPAMRSMGDVLGYEARFLALKASLRRAQRLLPEALGLLEAASRACADPDLAAKILVSRAKALEELGRLDEALAVLEEAGSHPGARGGLLLCIAQNRLDCLTKAGRFVEAMDLVPSVARTMEGSGTVLDLLRFRWTLARIAEGLGRSDEAIQGYGEVRDEFARRGLRYDAALSSLELAALHAELGRTAELLQVLEEALPILRELAVTREGTAAVRLLAQAAEERQVAGELVSQVIALLRRSESRGI